MSNPEECCCLTRVVGAPDSVELAQLHLLQQRLQSALLTVPATSRNDLRDALLNFGVSLVTPLANGQSMTHST